jgi:hypothetical protein
MATIGSAKATLVNKIDSLTSSATAKDTIFLAKALKENTSHHSFTFLGAWAASTAYALDDVVTTSGKTYICILAYTSGSSFAVGSNWSLMAEKGTDGTDVGTGTAGQVLKTNAAGNGTEWGADEGGKVLQMVGDKTSARSSTAVNMGVPTEIPNLSVNITPSATSSKVLITAMINHHADSRYCGFRVYRDSTPVGYGDGYSNAAQVTAQTPANQDSTHQE